jgi:glycogen(starch) synthase
MTLEALARLNHKLKMIGSDVTVVMFFITNRPCHSINPNVLNTRGIMEELYKNSQQIGKEVGDKLFAHLSSNAGHSQMPDLNAFMNETMRFRVKRTLQSWNTDTLPPVVTHNIIDDHKDDILNFIRTSGLINKKEDRVKIVYHPAFISPDNPLFGMEYSEFVRGCHLGVFPSYYEPWGYTPCEALASGVPAVTSDLAGFGDYVENLTSGDEDRGIKVLHRRECSFDAAAEDLANYMLKYATSTSSERIMLRTRAEDYAIEFDWKNLIRYYFDAYDHICGVKEKKTVI